jgi:hypothetical protein
MLISLLPLYTVRIPRRQVKHAIILGDAVPIVTRVGLLQTKPKVPDLRQILNLKRGPLFMCFKHCPQHRSKNNCMLYSAPSDSVPASR